MDVRRREILMFAVRKDVDRWEATVRQGTTRHEDPVVQRGRQYIDGGDLQEVTTVVHKYENDKLYS